MEVADQWRHPLGGKPNTMPVEGGLTVSRMLCLSVTRAQHDATTLLSMPGTWRATMTRLGAGHDWRIN